MKQLKLAGRAKRAEHFRSLHGGAGLNLVSLMDIFTILVFFLLVSSGSQQLPSSKDVVLPTSVAKKTPQETLIIAITKDAVLLQGVKVATISETVGNDAIIIAALEQELKYHASKRLATTAVASKRNAITIMGDEKTPYVLLRKILATCRQANYTNIAFAAFQKVKS